MRHTPYFALTLLAGCSAPNLDVHHAPAPKPALTARAVVDQPDEPPIEEPPIEEPPRTLDPSIGDPSGLEHFPAYREVSRESLAKLVQSQNQIATELYLRSIEGQKNMVMSPASISLAFGMVYAGARSRTARQMATTFRYNLPQSEIHAAFGTALRGLDTDEERPFELTVANRLFGEKTMSFTAGFVDVTKDHYQAELERLDFRHAPEPSRLHINDWVAKSTHDRIQDLLPQDSVKDYTSLVLTNAIYFKGKWKQAFPKASTKEETFNTPTASVKAQMMNLTGQHAFAEVDGVQMLQMAYKGDALAMQLVLPNAKSGLPALEKKLVRNELDALAGALRSREVIVSVPRFTLAPQEAIALSDTLKAMGLTDAWEVDKANLRGMAKLKPNQNLFLQEAFHKAFIEVEEAGTEAAAATAVVVGIGTTSIAPEPPPPVRFNADHPFLFVIRDVSTQAILFIGRVNDPTQK